MAITEYTDRNGLEAWGIPAGALKGVRSEVIDLAIDSASRLVDSYIGSVYSLPLEAVGRDVARATAVIAAYDLLSVRGFNPATPGADENFRLRYEDAIAWLDKVRKGDVVSTGTVGAPGEPAPTASSVGRPSVISSSQRGWSSRGGGIGGGFVGD